MKAKLHFYEIPFREKNLLRRGWLLELIKDGQQGWGDISPLPGWSRETLEEVKAQLDSFLPHFLENPDCLSQTPLYPSVRFGIESASSDLTSPLKSPFSIPLSGLLLGQPSEILKKADVLMEKGVSVAKLKVANLAFKEAKFLIEKLKNHFLLRVDVNRAWNSDDSRTFFRDFPPEIFEYIEEPVKKVEDLTHFDYPFAIDESFSEIVKKNIPFSSFPSLKAIIAKPTLWGNLSQLSSFPFKVILSSCFETGVGLYSIAKIAQQRSLLSFAHGLDTSGYLVRDVLKKPLKIANGHLHFPSKIEILEEFTPSPCVITHSEKQQTFIVD